MANTAGVKIREISNTGPIAQEPVGVPATVIGTSQKGPAFVPVTLANEEQFKSFFGATDGEKQAPLAAYGWLRNASALTFLRVLGVGQGLKRESAGTNAGKVMSAGFVVGDRQPGSVGLLADNPYANSGGIPGRTYVLGAFMSESAGSTVFSDAGIQSSATAAPIMRGMLMAASGVILRLSSSIATSSAPLSSYVAANATTSGSIHGTVTLLSGTQSKQEFVLLLNGHKGLDATYPNVISASFDASAPNYFGNVLNKDPEKMQIAGHLLYGTWDVAPVLAVVTGTGLIVSGVSAGLQSGRENCAFLTTGSLTYNSGSSTVPNFENFEDRFRHAETPWVISQKFGGSPKNLFKIHTLDDGAGPSTNVKFSIENLTVSTDTLNPYGTFDLLVRRWDDTDGNPNVLEAFRGLSLDPGSDNYVAKKIGDMNVYYQFDRAENAQGLVIDGSYENRSNYIRVEMSSEVDNQEVDPSSLPFGHRGPGHLVTSGTAPLTSPTTTETVSAGTLKKVVEPPVPYRLSVKDGDGVKSVDNSQYYWGTQFEKVTSLTLPNGSGVENKALRTYAKYFPDFMTTQENVFERYSVGVADTAEVGVVDVDRFNKNLFSLENIKVVTGSDGVANPLLWKSASYVRNGVIAVDDTAKTRSFGTSDLTSQNRRYAKFTLFAQGGFDGVNIFDKNEARINDVAVKFDMDDTARGLTKGPNVVSYTKALKVIGDKSELPSKLISVPGIRHEIVTDEVARITEERFDAFSLIDVEQYDLDGAYVTGSSQIVSVSNTISQFDSRGFNTSFAGAYFPDVVVEDPTTNSNVVVAPSVVVLEAFGFNDRVAHPWFAPAGAARGALKNTKETRVKLKEQEIADLQSAKINPIVSFGTDGPIIYGQKTLLATESAFNRINVRRLLIELRREVRSVGQRFIFEPNRETTLANFKQAVEPKLARIQRLRGIVRFLVKIDTSSTTQADVENRVIRGKIYVQPTRSNEVVDIDFDIKS